MTLRTLPIMNRIFCLLLMAAVMICIRPVHASAQGCSDAGVCTVPSMRSTAGQPVAPQYLQIGVSYGKGEREINAWNSSLQYGRSFGKSFSLNAKATFSSHSTKTVSASGLADIAVSASVRASGSVSILAGVKLPVSNGNRSENGMVLPMDFQPGLGTVDIVAGVSYAADDVHMTAALQQPVRQNANTFVSGRSSVSSGLNQYPTTSGFSRSGDAMFRLSVPFRFDGPWSLTPALVPIYHLANDTYTDSAGVTQTINGSQGLTLNAALFFRYGLERGDAVEMNIGFPLITRTARPDGLTRAFVVTAEYRMGL